MFEVDYLAVGEKSSSGDAIALRFTRPDTGDLAVVVIDGGFIGNGDAFVNLIRTHYGDRVDLVVSTHMDSDHIGGLTAVLEQLQVATLLIHRPALYGYTDDDQVSASRAEALVALARRRGVEVRDQDYAGSTYFGGALMLAGPSEEFYVEQLASMSTSDSALAQLKHGAKVLAASAAHAVRSLLGDPGETMTGDNGGTNGRNNSSIILDLTVEADDTRMLFTGDAGAPALTEAADLLFAAGRAHKPLDLFHVPHNGSRHNLTPELLDRLLGAKHQATQGLAIVSVAAEAHEYPRPEVANAVKRRGYPVSCTRGANLWWRSADAPPRSSYWAPAEPLGWLDESSSDASGSASGVA